MTTMITKETIQRLIKDVKQIIKTPLTDNGIYYIHDDTDMLKGYALIIGTTDTPYFGGNYFFELNFPTDYPHSPPKVKYCTNGLGVRFNPNLYVCGKVCVSLLNTWRGDQWTSCQTISTVLLTLCTVLCKNPLLNEPGISITHNDTKSYNEIVQYANIYVAVCDIVSKNNKTYMPFFDKFYSIVKENFLKNVDDILKIAVQKNIDLNNQPIFLKTQLYGMNITIDYNIVIDKLRKLV